jgi:hypothetical protein
LESGLKLKAIGFNAALSDYDRTIRFVFHNQTESLTVTLPVEMGVDFAALVSKLATKAA